MTRKAAHRSSPLRLFLFLTLLAPFLCAFVIYYGVGAYFLPKQRTTVLYLTDPVEVVSFEPLKRQWTRVQFPVDTHIAGIQGLGDYAIDSLWNIAATEGSPSAVVLGSITDELGVPVDYFVGEKNNLWTKEHSFFSKMSIFQKIRHTLETNISLPLYIALTRSFSSTESHTMFTAVLENGQGLVEKKLPDNSKVFHIDRDQFDAITENFFQDKEIREENIRVSIFNTTGRPFLGSRVARIVERLGVNVIQVGNEEESIEACEMSGLKDHLNTKTATTLKTLFDCQLKEISEEQRADLTVRIGKLYERRFLPKEN